MRKTPRTIEARLAALEAVLESLPERQTEAGATALMEAVLEGAEFDPQTCADLTAEYVELVRGRPVPRTPAEIRGEADWLEQASPALLEVLAAAWDREAENLASTRGG